MPKIIVTSRYIAPSVPKSHLEYYTKYIATRPGVVINNTNSVGIEPQKPSNPNDPVSEKQKQMIDQLLQDFKDAKKLFRFLYKGIIIKHNKTEPTYTKTSLFLCEKRRFFMARTEKGGKVFLVSQAGRSGFFHFKTRRIANGR